MQVRRKLLLLVSPINLLGRDSHITRLMMKCKAAIRELALKMGRKGCLAAAELACMTMVLLQPHTLLETAEQSVCHEIGQTSAQLLPGAHAIHALL